MAFIYIIRNRVNDKVYIGKTEFSVEKRFAEHCRDHLRRDIEKRPLYDAMKKHGVENFYAEAIEETNNADERERYWIERYGSYKYGYNATIGGDGRPYIDYDKVVEIYNNLQNCVEVAEIMGISADSVRNILHAKDIKIISSHDVLLKKCSKATYMFSGGKCVKSFTSVSDAGRYIASLNNTKSNASGICRHIRDVCNGKRKTAYGYSWAFNKEEKLCC